MEDVQREILQYSYWEHFKAAKDLALILPLEHPRRKTIETELNKIGKLLNEKEKQ